VGFVRKDSLSGFFQSFLKAVRLVAHLLDIDAVEETIEPVAEREEVTVQCFGIDSRMVQLRQLPPELRLYCREKIRGIFVCRHFE
jgi:hypothetical protein